MAIINGTDESDYLELDQDGITVNDIYNDGSINNNTINAGDGDDLIINSSSENNTLNGDDGDDLIINSSSENNTLNGGDGDDLISNPESNNNIINGGSGDDYVSNSGSNNIVNGDSGNDDLIILKGNDNIINGGDGNDDFKIAGGNNNTLIGNTEIDTFTFYYDVYDSSSIIEDFNASEEKINFSAYFDGFFETDAEKPRFSDLNISQSGSDTIISLFETSYFKEIIITLKNINQSDITADNFIGLNDNQENTAPDANDDYVAIIKSTSFSDDVLFNDTDADNDTLTVTQVNGQESNVGSQITLNSGALLTVNSNGTYDYDPNNQFNYLNSDDYEMDSFSYEISDGKGGFDTANVRITINGEGGFSNPIAVDDEIITPLTSSASGNLLDNDFSDDHDEYNKAYFISKINGEASNVGTEITLPSGALLTVYAQGDFDYNPNGQFIAPETSSDSFTYEISEYDGGIDTATVTITFYDDELVNEYFPIANNDFETIIILRFF